MKISAKINYACRALLELGLKWPDQSPLQIHTIAERQNIPMKFLPHIMIDLKNFGYVQSLRGKSGGYFLLKAPTEIRLNDLMTHLRGTGYFFNDDGKWDSEDFMCSIWQEIDEKIHDVLHKISLEVLCNRARNQQQTLIFEI